MGWVGLPEEGEGHTLLPEVLVGVGEEGAPPHLGADAVLWIFPGQAGAQFQAEAGFRIATVLADADLQGGEQRGAMRQGDGACGRRSRETLPSED